MTRKQKYDDYLAELHALKSHPIMLASPINMTSASGCYIITYPLMINGRHIVMGYTRDWRDD